MAERADFGGPFNKEALKQLARANMPHGIRVSFPMSVLLPQTEKETEEEYERFLDAVRVGLVTDEDKDLAVEHDWFQRWMEYAKFAFFAEASASAYELLTKTADDYAGTDSPKPSTGLTDFKRAVDIFKNLTMKDDLEPESEQ